MFPKVENSGSMELTDGIKAVLFDYDDTLMQTKKIKVQVIKTLGSRYYNFDISDELINEHWGSPFSSFYENIFMSVDGDLDRVLERREIINQEFRNQPYEDAKLVLTYLAAKYRVGIITAASRKAVDLELADVDLPIQQLDFIQTAEDTFYHKPDPKVFDPSIEKLSPKGIKRSEILYVGDSFTDYFAATDAGLHFIGVANTTTPEAAFMEKNIKFVRRLSDLKGIL